MAKCANCNNTAQAHDTLCGPCRQLGVALDTIEEKRLNVRMALQAVEGTRSGPNYKFHGGEGGMTDMRLKAVEVALHALFELVEALEDR